MTTAAVLIIGDEILSGRTQDTNTNYIARFLGALGIDLREARMVPDDQAEIVSLEGLRQGLKAGFPAEFGVQAFVVQDIVPVGTAGRRFEDR